MLWNADLSAANYSYVNPDQAVGGHQEINPDGCAAGPLSAPPARWGPGFQALPAIVILFQSPHCTQVLTFLCGGRSLCSGTGPEGKAAVSYQSEERV